MRMLGPGARGGAFMDSGKNSRSSRASETRTQVTLSGLLNVIDGVGSEDGKLFFATVSSVFFCLPVGNRKLTDIHLTRYADELHRPA